MADRDPRDLRLAEGLVSRYLVVPVKVADGLHCRAYRTRLHAKAKVVARRNSHDTAYVGSPNLSRAALLDGVEWNVRFSRVGTPALLDKFRATFDTYWNGPTFETYDPDRDRDRLDDALAEAAGRKQHDRATLTLSGLEMRSFPYQQEMLDALEVERVVHNSTPQPGGRGHRCR